MSDGSIKVVFRGSADPRESNGRIDLDVGENGEPRSLTLNGSPTDALVTPEELHMLTGRFQIEVIENEPTGIAEPPRPAVAASSPASPPEPSSPSAPAAQ